MLTVVACGDDDGGGGGVRDAGLDGGGNGGGGAGCTGCEARLLADIASGEPDSAPDSSPTHFTVVGSTTCFTATQPLNGRELWKTDGTTAGTQLVIDLAPGRADTAFGGLASVGSTLYFTADDGVHGIELWRSDGTAAGTHLVRDIVLGAAGSAPAELTAVGDRLFFSAYDAVQDERRLFVSNGEEAGTLMLPATDPTHLTAMGSHVCFASPDSPFTLHRSGGTAGNSDPALLTVFDGELYFAATSASSGRELWKTVTDGVAGVELWRTDGTPIGTQLLQDLAIGPGSSVVHDSVVLGTNLLMVVDDGETGVELWSIPLAGL